MLLKNFDVDEFWCQAGLAGFSVMTLTYLVGAEHKRLVNTNQKHLREFRNQNLLEKIYWNEIEPKQSDGTFHDRIS